MIAAMFRVMALSVIRDRGALALAFLLPPVIFLIFAAVFSGTGGGEIRLQIAIGTGLQSAFSSRLEEALRNDGTLRVLPGVITNREEMVRLIQSGRADAGLYIESGPDDMTSALIRVLVDPGKMLAGAILAGQVQRVIARDLPDVLLARSATTVEQLTGGWSAQQTQRLAAALDEIQREGGADDGAAALVTTEQVGSGEGASASISYYAGAIAMLFLLFSSMQGAATLIEERHAGILDRVAVGPAGTDVVVLGKFLFLTVQGMVQVALIFLAAALFYDLEVTARPGVLIAVTVVASASAAGLGLALAAFCTSKQQAQTVSTFVVLVSSALGGSMVPRFMMPPWLQDIGWFTPNAWAVEAYYGILWRNDAMQELLPELSLLASLAAVGLVASLAVSRWRLSL